MRNGITFEVCVDSIESAIAATEGGADRVELCSDLLEGGLTPSYGALTVARRSVRIGIVAMIRPRGGDFCYSDLEFASMEEDLEAAKEAGVDGVVLGLLKPDGTVDGERTGALIQQARPLRVTFHRAFDMTPDPLEALDTLIALGVDRVLTSGQEASVVEGLELIAELVSRASGRIVVMPGGGITARNIERVIARTGVREVHVACSVAVDGRMRFRNTRVFMGGALRPPEYTLGITRAGDVARTISAAALARTGG